MVPLFLFLRATHAAQVYRIPGRPLWPMGIGYEEQAPFRVIKIEIFVEVHFAEQNKNYYWLKQY
jgi:hypothetical protein